MDVNNSSIQNLLDSTGFKCKCGRTHSAMPLQSLKIAAGAIQNLPQELRQLGAESIFIVADNVTEGVAGRTVREILEANRFNVNYVCLHGQPKVLPNEEYRDILSSTCPISTDFVLGVGSGVINDLCKMLASSRNIPCGIVATAPSMDGFASNSSAMDLGGIKTTVYTTCPSLVLCDTDILRSAPFALLAAGLGDMAAKLISIADWKIAHLITGEYYCSAIADVMTSAYSTVISCAEALAKREEFAIEKLMEGLVLSGMAMTMAGISRPASGMEHTVSHILEMFALARGSAGALHGLQVGFGVREALKLYQKAYSFTPNESTCRFAASKFDETVWEQTMRMAFGSQAADLIWCAQTERRNDPENILHRGITAVKQWSEIKAIIGSVLSQKAEVTAALNIMNIPTYENIERLGYSKSEAHSAVAYSRDLRSRYIFTSLCFDIGLE